MPDDPAAITAAYFDSWKRHDFETYRSLRADDVIFDGRLGHTEGADETVNGIKGMASQMDDLVIQQMFVNGSDVLTWFDLHLKGIDQALPTANWSHIENGKITRIRETFDPRPIFEKRG